MLSVGYAGRGGCRFETSSDVWMTASATFKNLHFFGDVDGRIHLFASSPNDASVFERRCVEKLHRSTISAASVVNVGDVLLLSTASCDGFVRLWKVDVETDRAKISQVGEFFGRGLPLVSLAAVVSRNQSKKDEVHLLVCDVKGVYVLALHMLFN